MWISITEHLFIRCINNKRQRYKMKIAKGVKIKFEFPTIKCIYFAIRIFESRGERAIIRIYKRESKFRILMSAATLNFAETIHRQRRLSVGRTLCKVHWTF